MADSQPVFQIEKIYLKDLSLELPNAPQIFLTPESPQVDVQVQNVAQAVAEDLYESLVRVTVTARSGERTMFLVEVEQAGLFTIRGLPREELEPLLGIACPTILYPYAREAVSDLVTRGGFPPVLLSPVSFEAMYAQRLQQGAASGEPRIEIAS